MRDQYIYLISNGSDVKIGVSDDPERRVKQLQTGSAQVLRLIQTYQVEEAFKLEKKIHAAVSCKYQKRGEWFRDVNLSLQSGSSRDAFLWDLQCIIEEILEENGT